MTSTRGSLGAESLRDAGRDRLPALAWTKRLSGAAWGAATVTAGFIALSVWWIAIDRGVPYNDAAQHLFFALRFHDQIGEGQLQAALDFPSFYPPATFLLGALGAAVGGVSVSAPIVTQNLVYVPLLALACYQIARRLAGSAAGLLAVVFALGSPLIIEQFHVFMLDAPQAALVAVGAWLILASERFSRVGIAALAGLAVGAGLASKSLTPLYLAPLVVCVLARDGGWRNWRGLTAFLTVAFVVGAPWYIRQLTIGQGGGIFDAAGAGRDVPPAAAPSTLSLTNLAWYFWATLNGLLFAPLFVFAAVGAGAAVARVARARPKNDLTLELLCGLVGAWLAITLVPHHDMRYTMGLIPFVAVLGTVWIVRLAAPARTAAVTLLAGAILVAHVGATFGAGAEATHQLPGARRAAYGEGVPPRGTVIVYSDDNFLVSGPRRDPDVPGLFKALRRDGVTAVGWFDQVEPWDKHFEDTGVWVLARVAGLQPLGHQESVPQLAPGQAIAIRAAQGSSPDACLRLGDGSELSLLVGTPDGSNEAYCPGSA